MSDPPRLSAMHRSGLTATMLDSARDDDPPASSRQRALVAFGTGAGAMLSAGMAEGGAGVAKVVTWIAIAKWAGGGALVAVAAATAIGNVSPRAPTTAVEPAKMVSTVSVSPPVATPTAPVRAADPAPPTVVEPSPDLAAAPSRPAQASPMRAGRVAPAGAGADPAIERPAPDATLTEEVRWLDRASLSIRSGDVERGLQLLDEYKGRFPSGTMTPESQVLRIEALVRKGDRVNANRLGDEFLARAPQSALAARVRSLLLSKQKEQAP